MFTFLIFLLLSGLSFVIYVYFSNQIVSLRKQIILLTNQNNELRNKLNKLRDIESSGACGIETPVNVSTLQEEIKSEEESS